MKKGKRLKMKTELKSTKAITLVALVVTVVVLLILAGVSLNLILGQNGIIAKAKESKNLAEKDAENTDKGLSELANEMYEALGEDVALGQVVVGIKAEKNSTINGKTATATNPIIPKGYIAINTKTSTWGDGTSSPTEADVNKGLVITDSVIEENGETKSNGNEWVWVPVPDASIMYETSETPLPLFKSPSLNDEGMTDPLASLTEDVTTKKYSKTNIITRGKPGIDVISEIVSSGEGEDKNTLNYREPDLSGEDYDSTAQSAGFTNLLDMAKNIVKDYDEMIASIEKYKGFYIGRYELSDAGEKKGQTTYADNWYKLYAKCKSLSSSSKVETRMIWGCQWDVTCNWIANNGDKKSITDSRSWGNYKDSVAPANTDNYVQGEIKETGSNEAWQANNIYDLAGNCTEITQEAKISRGGYYSISGSEFPVSSVNTSYTTATPGGGGSALSSLKIASATRIKIGENEESVFLGGGTRATLIVK